MMNIKCSRDVRIVLITLLFVFSIAATFIVTKNVFLNTKSPLSGDTIKYTLVNISDLNTAEYHYTHVEPYDSENRRIFWNTIPIPNTNSEGVYSYQGVVTAGIDFSKIDVELNKKQKVLTITLPEATVIYSSPDSDSLKVYYEKNNIFNPMTYSSYNELYEKVKKYEETAAIENGLLTRANDNAKSLIENFIRAVYSVDEYEIVFKTKVADAEAETTETVAPTAANASPSIIP